MGYTIGSSGDRYDSSYTYSARVTESAHAMNLVSVGELSYSSLFDGLLNLREFDIDILDVNVAMISGVYSILALSDGSSCTVNVSPKLVIENILLYDGLNQFLWSYSYDTLLVGYKGKTIILNMDIFAIDFSVALPLAFFRLKYHDFNTTNGSRQLPTRKPTSSPSYSPTYSFGKPTPIPSYLPTITPTRKNTCRPTVSPTRYPTTLRPTGI
jgi:hypothetical protein